MAPSCIPAGALRPVIFIATAHTLILRGCGGRQGGTTMQEFSGKNAVITGGGSGIGRGMALAFAREGMNVLISDVELDAAETVAAEIRALGRRGIAARTDVAKLEDVEALGRLAFDSFGEVHVLCPNAGVSYAKLGIHADHRDWTWM